MPQFTITFTDNTNTFTVTTDGKETLLTLIRDAGVNVRKACRNGACGICRCRVVAGNVTYDLRQPFALWEEDITQGYILPCIAFPTSDLNINEITLEKNKRSI